jgi:hypothetical protein
MNGMNYRQWDTLNDRQHEIFTDNLFLDGECATSPEHYVKGAVESCGCPDTEEDLQHHSPVLMREIEKQQEMLPDMTVKISESLGFLNEMIDKELFALLEQSYERRFEPVTRVDPFGAQVGSGDIEDYEEKGFEKVRVPEDPKKRKKRKKDKQKVPTPAEIAKAAKSALDKRLQNLKKQVERNPKKSNAGELYEIDIVKALLGPDPFHTLLAGRDVIAGSGNQADAAIAIDGKIYDIEVKSDAGDPMSSGGIIGEFEESKLDDATGQWVDGELKFFKGSSGLPPKALLQFLEDYKKTTLEDDMKKWRNAVANFDYPDGFDPKTMVKDKNGRVFLAKKDSKTGALVKIDAKNQRQLYFPKSDMEKSALKKLNATPFLYSSGLVPGAAWDTLGSKALVGQGLKRKAERYTSDPIESTSDFIKNRYNKKGVYYIQVGGKGLYLLGDKDPAGLKKYGIPDFEIGDMVNLELRMQPSTYKPSKAPGKKLIDKINAVPNLTDEEREYLLGLPPDFFKQIYLRFSARIQPDNQESLEPSPVSLDNPEHVRALVDKLCDDGRYTGVPTLTPEAEQLNAEAISYCARKALDKQKPSPVAVGPGGDGSNQLPGPFNRDEE